MTGTERSRSEDLPAHGDEDRATVLDIGRGPAGHDRERAVDRSLDAARHRRVDQAEAGFRELRPERARADRRGRAHVDDQRARGEAGEDVVLAVPPGAAQTLRGRSCRRAAW